MLTNHFGEIIAVFVAFLWTGSALSFEYAGKRIGSLMVNILRLLMGFLMLGCLLFYLSGSVLPIGADANTWFWMLLSGVVGFVFGDLCLFHSYLIITSRFSQLIMTLAPPTAAIFGYFILSERMNPMSIIGMMVTLFGIGFAILNRNRTPGSAPLSLNLPLRGVLLALGGAVGQGLGIVLSKKGMDVYALSTQYVPDNTIYIPFAATQIRIIAGIVGFTLVIAFAGMLKNVPKALTDKKAMRAITIGSVCGPFLGVSLSLLAVQYTTTGSASTVMATVPIMIIIPSILLFKQKVTPREVIGAVISVIGVALLFIG